VRLSILIAALALGAGGLALADDLTQLFISPMGEPFRAADSQPYPSAAWFAGADANKDGVLSLAEFRADALRFFKTLDVNGDGRLTELEIVRYEKQIAPEIVSATFDTSDTKAVEDSQGRKQPITLYSSQGATYFGLINSPEPVRAADGDFNGKITQDEWMAAADRRFRLLAGEDADGFKLSQLPKTPAQIRLKK
jgi:hypothetical protein